MAMFHSEGVYRVGGGVSVPRLLVNNPPEYTAEAGGARIEGQVELLVTTLVSIFSNKAAKRTREQRCKAQTER
jgi:hypothetical protein